MAEAEVVVVEVVEALLPLNNCLSKAFCCCCCSAVVAVPDGAIPEAGVVTVAASD